MAEAAENSFRYPNQRELLDRKEREEVESKGGNFLSVQPK